MVDSIKLLTFNVGLLQLKLFGFIPIFANPEYVSQRRPHIPQKLREVNADIIALQECYEDSDANFIIHALSDLYPYSARHSNPSWTFWKFHNGLVFLSKYPITHSYIEKLNKAAPLELWMANKSLLVMTISVPSIGEVTLVNSHTTAGGATHPEHPDVDGDREDELRQSINACNTKIENYAGGIIIGDLNCGPEASAANYNYLVQTHNYRDTYLEAEETNKLLPGPKHSWDPNNYLNVIGPHSHCPGQRCDHVLLQRGYELDNWSVESAGLVFEERYIDIGKSDILSTLSDHYGLVVTLKRTSERKNNDELSNPLSSSASDKEDSLERM